MGSDVGDNAPEGMCISEEWMKDPARNSTQGFSIQHVCPPPAQHLAHDSGTIDELSARLWAPQGHLLSILSLAQYLMYTKQILAKLTEVVSTCCMQDITLAGGKTKIWSTCRVAWQGAQDMVGSPSSQST